MPSVERIKITVVGSGYVGIDVIIFEPRLNESSLDGIKVINSLSRFKDNSDVIVTNRDSENLQDVRHKVFTRDLFNVN